MTILRRLTSRLLLVIVSLAFALLVCEAAFRVFVPQPILFDTEAIWEPAEGIGRRPKPNIDVSVNTGERDARVITDEWGHRVGPSRRPPGALRVLAIGDSMLQAIQVNYEQTLTALLERALSASLGRETEVVNAGMGGWNPNQYLIAARTELERSRYDLLLVFVYLENDIIGRRVTSFPPASGLFAPVLKPLEDPVGVTWDKSIALSRIMLRRHSHLFVYIDNLMVVIPARAGTREHLLTNTLRSRADSPTWQVTADILADISAAARTLHTPVLYVLLPPAHFIDQRTLGLTERMLGIDHADVDLSQPAHRMIAELSSRHLEVVDATPALKQAFDDLEGDLYGRVDKHFGLAGHRVIARFLEPVVREFLAGAHYVSPYWLDF